MIHQHPPCQCVNCQDKIPPAILRHSINFIGYALCMNCQDHLRYTLKHTSRETAKLYFLLKSRGIPAELVKPNGYKNIDIAISNAKVNIEVDRPKNDYHHQQAITDLKQRYYSFNKGYYTLRIPNEMVAYDHNEAVEFIEEFLKVSCSTGSNA